ncbi:MAG: Nramp family divalent metal transporter [Alphaproteobacteria bacterium]|nr:Nramp family divalent metal transporter [Alphaproteobacteria bacterium]
MTPPPDVYAATVGLSHVHRTPTGFWLRLATIAGPGYLIAVGYMDPGNWATDMAAGSEFGFALLPVVILSSAAGLLLQILSMKLGVATGRDLAQHCRAHYSPAVSRFLWLSAEVAVIACDLAEVIGTAIALQLLFNLPILYGMGVTALSTLALLNLEARGFRKLEAIVIVLVATVCLCLLYEVYLSRPDIGDLAASFAPNARIMNSHALCLSLGILGATVMPHNLYLHSSLYRGIASANRNETIRFARIDCVIALGLAAVVNAAILIVAACAVQQSGFGGVLSFGEAYRLLTPALGAGAASTVFAIALLAAGQSSTITATMAGQVVMGGFLGWNLNAAQRRLLTRCLALVPAVGVVAIAGESRLSDMLVFSQVVLSLQLAFAVVPLVMLTSSGRIMGAFANSRTVKYAAYVITGIIIVVNASLLFETLR